MRATGNRSWLLAGLAAGAAGTALAAMPPLGASSAQAQAQASGPPLMPTRDVAVLYDVRPEGAPQAQAVRVYFKGGGDLMRIDGPPGPDGSSSGDMIMDRDAKLMTVVVNQARIYMQVPEREVVRSPFVLDASMRFARTGGSVVAGVPCTTWSIVTDKGNATACVTADGVVLRESGVDGEGARGELTARTVQYGPLPATLFAPPAGYQRTAHPQGLGQGLNGSSGPGGPPGGPPDGLEDGAAGGPPPGAPSAGAGLPGHP